MILSYDANLGRMEFSEGTGVPIYRKGCGSSVLVFDEELDVIVVLFSRHFLEASNRSMPRAIQHILNRIVSEIRVPLIMRLFRKPDISLGQIFPFSLQHRVRFP